MTFISSEELAAETHTKIGRQNAVLFIDFDGTLAPIHKNPFEVKLTGDNKELLLGFSRITQIQLIVVSGRDLAFLQDVLNGIPISIAGEHGAVFYNKHTMTTENLGANQSEAGTCKNIQELSDKLHQLEQKYPGTFLERKNTSIAFHYRNIEDNKNIHALMDRLSEFEPNSFFQVIRGKDVFEFSFSGTSKGSFISWWLEKNRSTNEYIPISIGDDTTDEFMFEACNKLGGLSIKVGEGSTQACYRLNGTEEVSCFLDKFLSLLSPPSRLT